MHSRLLNLLVAAAFINLNLFISCQKEENEPQLPNVSIITPGENTSFSSGDTIKLVCLILDDGNINSVDISVKDESDVPILSKTLVGGASPLNFEQDLVIPGIEKGGTHYIEVRAFDDAGSSVSFRYISIGESSFKFQKIILITEGIQKTEVFELREEEMIKLSQVPGDFHASDVDMKNGLLYTLGQFNGDLTSYDTSGAVQWTYEAFPFPSVPFFHDVNSDGTDVLVSVHDGRIVSHDHKGSRVMEKLVEEDHYPRKLIMHEKLVVFERVHQSNGTVELATIHYPSGLLKGEEVLTEGDVVEMFSWAWDEVMLFTNDGESSYIMTYNSERHFFTQIDYRKSGAEFHAVERVSDDFFALSRGSGLDLFQVSERIYFSLSSEFAPEKIRWNEADNTLWCIKGSLLKVYDLNTRDEIQSLSLEREVDAIEILNSK